MLADEMVFKGNSLNPMIVSDEYIKVSPVHLHSLNGRIRNCGQKTAERSRITARLSFANSSPGSEDMSRLLVNVILVAIAVASCSARAMPRLTAGV